MVVVAAAVGEEAAATTAVLSPEEQLRRTRRKGSYHLVASRNKLPDHKTISSSAPDDDDENYDEEEDMLFRFLTVMKPNQSIISANKQELIQEAKIELLRELGRSNGDVNTPIFTAALEQLVRLYDRNAFDARKMPPRPKSRKSNSNKKSSSSKSKSKSPQLPQMEGMWITLSKPNFRGKQGLGMNDNGDFRYTLGSMSFDMYRPGNLVCSIQGTFNPVHVIDGKNTHAIENVPKALFDEVREGSNVLRSYDIVTAFTIEPRNPDFGPKSPNQVVEEPIEGLITTYGYVLPNPDNPHRLAVWFSGGIMEVDSDLDNWKRVFHPDNMPKRRRFRESARVLGAQLLMGASTSNNDMEVDGRMSYQLQRPIGGHETSYIDILYLDETLRIAKSNAGSLFVFARVPTFPDE